MDPVLLKDEPQQTAAQMGFAPIQPLAMPQALPLAAGPLPPGSIANLTELQGVIVGQPVLGQAQLAGLGQGILTETQQGLMVASPAQTLNDTLDDIMAGGFILLRAGIKYDLLKASKSVPEFFAVTQLKNYFWTLDPCISLEILFQSQKFSDGYRSN